MGGKVKTLLSAHVESSRRADNNSHTVAMGGASAALKEQEKRCEKAKTKLITPFFSIGLSKMLYNKEKVVLTVV